MLIEAYRIKAGDRVQFEGAIVEVEAVTALGPDHAVIHGKGKSGFIAHLDTLVIKL